MYAKCKPNITLEILTNLKGQYNMDKACKLSDVEFEELDNISLKIDGTTYQLAKVTKYPENFSHCDICSLYDKCCHSWADVGVCSLFGDLIGMDYHEKDKLFFN